MRKIILSYVIVLLCALTACQQEKPSTAEEISTVAMEETKLPAPAIIVNAENPQLTLNRIAFGSCNREDLPQVMWKEIITQQPELWMWLGDNVYGDTEEMSELAAKYDKQKSNEAYLTLRNQAAVIGIWDDHDYGVNDGDKHYPKKAESKALMLDFLDVPKNNPVFDHKGAYNAYTFGEGAKKVKVILLDGRSFRDTLQKRQDHYQRYYPNEEGDILGEEQWQWLEQELTDSDATIHIVACGIQMIAKDHGFEKWANFPRARKRLFDLLVSVQPNRPVLVSGDRHIGEISKMEVEGLPYPLYEITSSGLTHSYEEGGDEPNSYRVSLLVTQKHYATFDIDWENIELPTLKATIRGLENVVFAEQEVTW